MSTLNMIRGCLIVLGFVAANFGSAVSAVPLVRGLQGKHPLNDRSMGDLLIGELRCVSCHRPENTTRFVLKAAPILDNVGNRVSPSYLQRFIANPSVVHPGTTMPNMLAGESANSRDNIALAITHFLKSRAGISAGNEPNLKGNAKDGRKLFHTIGCIACHASRDANDKEIGAESTGTLKHAASKYDPDSLAAFLFQPKSARPSGRMPDMNLTKQEAVSIARFLIGDAKRDNETTQFKVDMKLADAGRKYFKQFNCVACHKLQGFEAPSRSKDLAKLNTTRGCLSGATGKHPHFNLSKTQQQAIKAALSATDAKPSDKDRINSTLTAFNCIACHVRDDFGGVSADTNQLFQTTEPNLGDDARIPPPLTQVGAKLNLEWMQKVLFDRESVRPYMLTRMPQFGEKNLRHLPQLFEKTDEVKHVAFAEPDRDKNKLYRSAGQLLLGDKGLNCVTCHKFNGKPSPSFQGIDLMTTQQRLKPSWYSHFMKTPAKFRPGTIMPTYWPDGTAVRKDILDGNTDAQIEAMWYYFSLGQSARDPSGILREGTKLLVTNTTLTYRGRSGIAGYRGIAVGFPGGLNYAFNAETGTLTGLWRGEFVSVGWSGQGSGGFNPAGRAVSLAQDVSFYRLPNEKTAWPLRPCMTKEQPINPDPLYPKNRGYQFKGYELDGSRIPTFIYRTGAVTIHDRSVAKTRDGKQYIERTFSFTATDKETIWLRALTGKLEAVSTERFKSRDIQLTASKLTTLIRNPGTDKAELLIKLDLPKGQSTAKIDYELLR